MSEKSKKIIFATGIYPPDVGGPAMYVKNLAQKIIEAGYEIDIITYANDSEIRPSREGINVHKINRRQNLFKRYLAYYRKVIELSAKAELIYAFDISSAGIPAWLGAFKLKKIFLVRIGGDFLWEKAAEKEWTNLPLPLYYQRKKSLKERVLFKLIRLFVKRINTIIFSVDWLKDIYMEYYGVKEENTQVIANPFPSIEFTRIGEPKERDLLFAGRLIKLKNLSRVLEAIKDIPDIKFKIYGSGPEELNLRMRIEEWGLQGRVIIYPRIEHYKLLDMMKKAYLVIVPSLSEVSPNTVLECIKLKQPVLVTNECGYYRQFKNYLISIDPMSPGDIKMKIEMLLDKKNYRDYAEKIRSIDTSRGWGTVAREHTRLFEKKYNI